MMDRDDRWGFRMCALLALLVLALGVASCGDDDDGDDGNGGAAAQTQPQADVDPASFDNSPEGQIRALHAKFIDVFYDKDYKTVCDLTTQKGQRQWAKNAKSCEDGLKKLFASINKLSENRPRITKLRIDGPQAIAQTKVKGSNTYPVPFRKEDGQWKMDAGGGP